MCQVCQDSILSVGSVYYFTSFWVYRIKAQQKGLSAECYELENHEFVLHWNCSGTVAIWLLWVDAGATWQSTEKRTCRPNMRLSSWEFHFFFFHSWIRFFFSVLTYKVKTSIFSECQPYLHLYTLCCFWFPLQWTLSISTSFEGTELNVFGAALVWDIFFDILLEQSLFKFIFRT